uniref:Uncharacterized protein n=1 Tax=Panagrolaimus sp. JU765 TaxID=591449 RepID=A0AC34RD55_9BILA
MAVYFGTYKDSAKIKSLNYGHFFNPKIKHIAVGFADRLEFWKLGSNNAIQKEFSYKTIGLIVSTTMVKLKSSDKVMSLATLTADRKLLIHSVSNDFSCKESAMKVVIKADVDKDVGNESPQGTKMFAFGDLVSH